MRENLKEARKALKMTQQDVADELGIGLRHYAICRSCKHFLQHYIQTDRGYMKVFAGHCTTPRVKDKEPYDTCKYFQRVDA